MCRLSGMKLLVVFVAAFLGSCSMVVASYRCTEYGIGILGLRYGHHDGAVVLFDSPDSLSDTIAVWHRDSIRFADGDSAVLSRATMLEYDYEIVGFPVLEFSEDTTWVRITHDCNDSLGKTDAWIRVNREMHDVRTWTEILSEHLLFFRDPEDVRFYAKVKDTSQLALSLAHYERSGRLDYIMYPQTIEGSWMEVVVETPSTYCKDADNPKRIRTWIRFLDEKNRPLVYFYTRGC